MAIKQALIVDDSRSARVVLKRMLEELDFVVNTLESATDAIDYLKKYQPDVIFMDHMMPGMDGFEAVKSIKNNPQTAVIPIMMYTSRGGDVYLSQARALGAVGVIPKTISSVGLKESLFKLGLIGSHQVSMANDVKAIDSKPQETRADPDKVEQQIIEKDLVDNQAKHDAYIENLRRLMDDQTIELHKSMWLGIESVSHEIFNRLSSEFEERFEKIEALPQDVAAELKIEKGNEFTRPIFIVSVLLALSMLLNIILLLADRQPEKEVKVSVEKQTVVPVEPPRTEQLLADNKDAAIEFIEWAQNKKIEYPYDELALNDNRLATIEEIVKKALAAEYTGSIILQTHVGQFCMNRDGSDNYVLADHDLSIAKCEYIGNYLQPSDSPATHQSLSFANYLSDSGLWNEKGIAIEVANEPRIFEISKYPKQIPETTVKDWNLAAQLNNLVTIKLNPAPLNIVGEE